MYIIAGLGNPGKKYENTRHNMGFQTIDRLADKHGLKTDKIKFKSLVGEGRIAGQKVLLLKPQTYMNLSGEAIRDAMNFYKLDPENLIVIYDDLDIPAGSLRIRKSGSAGTHNGMRSVVYQLNSDQFPRIRVGIGKEQKGDIVNFVIGNVTKDEIEPLEQAIDTAVLAIESILDEGIDKAMNKYNTKKNKRKKDDE